MLKHLKKPLFCLTRTLLLTKKKILSKTQSSSVVKSSDFAKKNEQESQSSIGTQQPLQSGSTPGAMSERSEAPQGVGSLPTCNYCKKKSPLLVSVGSLRGKMNLSHRSVRLLEMTGKP